MAKKINIALLDLKREYKFLKKDIDRELKDCFSSQHWILGEKVSQLENQVAKYLGAKYSVGVASGTDALILSLRALAIKLKNKEYFDKEDEIITTPFTFVATAEAIVRSGATPVFVDINPHTFNIDPEQIKKAITRNTVGIIPVHLFGLACEMDTILEIARENKLFIVEDVAQAFGAEYRSEVRGQKPEVRKKLGTIGDCGAFSFFPSKNLGGYGDAGLVATNNPKLAEIIRVLRTHGQIGQYNAAHIGYNSRLDTIQAAILLAKLKYVDKFNALRIKNAQKYNSAFKNIKDIQLPAYNLPALPAGRQLTAYSHPHVYNLYTIKVPIRLRDKFLKFLNDHGIGARVYYPFALHEMEAFNSVKTPFSLTNTEKAAASVISLPIHPFLTSKEINYIVKTIQVFMRNCDSVSKDGGF
ncbi:MAG: DegT/DnrJ/EryC1/StrS family aminotransferase [Candidatus Omnitrophota bacterium]|nr:DegT/DnrJ/EryC1/StrS family aminotransferase [Candidatus Omnitrophota bacterium]